ncbi:GNAT family N-acetyltransferase [Calycomorphotria hydatis]|uniref:Aminoglycoside N(6')-acetyltransferase type 1 n=1 Tax=Calycomorphotria hydatis TaxID=2528027 RepID=A0A517TCV4_9PLAN|nr:GNAT family N-acetyltransferase [Calycomorphotria hydatis]QDT66205.1 Aminoglycoside N(6')-acetyltransferase type 1 [Calycomorphotria hydatis]
MSDDNCVIRPLEPQDREAWLALRSKLWPASSSEQLASESTVTAENDKEAVYVAAVGDSIIGFAEASLRNHAEGCRQSPVGYLEGWFVEPGQRSGGVGRQLVEVVENWARDNGCEEMASDCVLGNTIGIVAHEHLGYRPTVKCVFLKKSLVPKAE